MTKALVFLPLAVAVFTAAMPQTGAAASSETLPVAVPAADGRVRVAMDTSAVPVQSLTAVPGKPLPLTIKPPASGVQDVKFVMVRGVPEGASFTAGFRVRQSWFIAARDLARAELMLPAGTGAGFTLELIFFRASEEPPLGNSLLEVKVAAARNTDGQESRGGQMLTSASPLDDLDIAPKPQPQKGRAAFTATQEADMLKRAENFMRLGDVSSARLLFEDLAAHGSAKGALAMGRSFDPSFLRQVFVAGNLAPDREKAKLWYQRAQDLGDPDAGRHLAALEL